MRFFRSRAFSAANARLAADVLRDVRLDLPARPVLPGRPGLQPVPGWPADAAVDGDADHRRPDRRASSPTGSAARPILVTGMALQADRASAGSPPSSRRRSSTSRSSCRSSSPASAWACSSRRSPTSSCRRSARRGGQGVGRQQHDPRGRRRVRGRRPGRGLQRERRLHVAGGIRRLVSSRPSRSAPSSSRSGRSPRSFIPARAGARARSRAQAAADASIGRAAVGEPG